MSCKHPPTHSHKEPAQSLLPKQRYPLFFLFFLDKFEKKPVFCQRKTKNPTSPSVPSLQPNPFLLLFLGGRKPQQQKPTRNTRTNLQTSNLNAREDIRLGGLGAGSGREPTTGEGERRTGISKPQHLRANAPPKNGDSRDWYSRYSQSTTKHFLPTPSA